MIGIFDSGIGGLTVVRALRVARPDLSYVYLGDTARAPYGTKSPETIRRYAEDCVDFLLGQGAKAIIIACNTASSVAAGHLRARHPGLPIFEVVGPAVRAAHAASHARRIGLIGTRATVSSGVYEKLLKELDPDVEVFARHAQLLVPLVEEGWVDEPETSSIIVKYVTPLREAGIDILILACTHFPVLAGRIDAAMGAGVSLIDSAEAVVAEFRVTIEGDKKLASALDRSGRTSYFVTDPTPSFAKIGSAWIGEEIVVQKADIAT
ncbi:MAG TPA: glutamate racemase [Candidatus Baltobacteraceae bacterium]|nr:glutamate racemase [Candidatus Baltobacteraceae bacterium]